MRKAAAVVQKAAAVVRKAAAIERKAAAVLLRAVAGERNLNSLRDVSDKKPVKAAVCISAVDEYSRKML